MKNITYDDTKWKLVPVEPTEAMLKAGLRGSYMSVIGAYVANQASVYEAMLSVSPEPPAAESKAEQRMSALYNVVCEVVASDDRAINITRLHDYLSGEDIPASAVVCEAEPQGQQHTGWPPGMLQDDSRELARALSSKPDARLHVREAAAAIRAKRVPLSYDQIRHILDRLDAKGTPWNESPVSFVREIEAAHGIHGDVS